MTPEQKIKYLILNQIAKDKGDVAVDCTAENINDEWDAADSEDIQEAQYEIRHGDVETGLIAPYSRHYEAKEVAAKAPDGSWVGWTYWYGGGKHGEPEAVDWIEHAYDLECKEEEKLVIVRTFTKTA